MLGTGQGGCPLDNGFQQLLFVNFVQQAQCRFVKGAHDAFCASDDSSFPGSLVVMNRLRAHPWSR
jgi:hypothetical protein